MPSKNQALCFRSSPDLFSTNITAENKFKTFNDSDLVSVPGSFDVSMFETIPEFEASSKKSGEGKDFAWAEDFHKFIIALLLHWVQAIMQQLKTTFVSF